MSLIIRICNDRKEEYQSHTVEVDSSGFFANSDYKLDFTSYGANKKQAVVNMQDLLTKLIIDLQHVVLDLDVKK